jgi:hypothetical protein
LGDVYTVTIPNAARQKALLIWPKTTMKGGARERLQNLTADGKQQFPSKPCAIKGINFTVKND